jgi:hypothetical protein
MNRVMEQHEHTSQTAMALAVVVSLVGDARDAALLVGTISLHVL